MTIPHLSVPPRTSASRFQIPDEPRLYGRPDLPVRELRKLLVRNGAALLLAEPPRSADDDFGLYARVTFALLFCCGCTSLSCAGGVRVVCQHDVSGLECVATHDICVAQCSGVPPGPNIGPVESRFV